jgi:hypothetical protein
MSTNEDRITVPVVYVDAAEVHAFPYTMQVMLGSATPDGVQPRVQLALSPGFAMHLVESLQRALAEYRAPSTPEVTSNASADERPRIVAP